MEKVAYRIEHLTDLGEAFDVAERFRAKGFRVQIVVYGEKITLIAEL